MTSNSSPRSLYSESIGSRIRLIFGNSGSEWLLLLNEDDGNHEFQTSAGMNIPNVVAAQIDDCNKRGQHIKEIDFGPFNTWFIKGIQYPSSRTTSTGEMLAWWNTDAVNTINTQHFIRKPDFRAAFGSRWGENDNVGEASYVFLYGRNRYRANCNGKLLSRLDRIQRNNKEVHFVRLFHNDSYFISDSDGTEWDVVNEQCGIKLQQWNKAEEVAVARDGSWVVVFPMDFTYSSAGVDERLIQTLREFYSRQRARNQKRAEDMARYNFGMAHARAELERQRRVEAAERARLQAEQERQRREEAEERARVEQREAAARQENEARLERQIWREAQSVSFLESLLQNHKRSLQEMVTQLPPERRPRVEQFVTTTTVPTTATTTSGRDTTTGFEKEPSSNSPSATASGTVVGECVVCNDATAEMAIVPCGHYCLCENCSKTLITLRNRQRRVCPLCRVPIQKTLKIFIAH
jgi:hypothetical protein